MTNVHGKDLDSDFFGGMAFTLYLTLYVCVNDKSPLLSLQDSWLFMCQRVGNASQRAAEPQPETRAVMDLIQERGFTLSVALDGGSVLVTYPYDKPVQSGMFWLILCFMKLHICCLCVLIHFFFVPCFSQLKMMIRWDIWLLCMQTTILQCTWAILDVQTAARVCWFPFILQVFKTTVYFFSNKKMLSEQF